MRVEAQMPDTEKILRGLKDFQRKTVDYVFMRLYEDRDTVNRFLIADEVGLGKTLVARGVIAKSIEKLWNRVGRIDIIYICSSSDIARQNINRLNITGAAEFSYATRLTMLPTQISGLNDNKLNFISFTPGTSFNLRSSGGMYKERVLLYYILKAGLNYGNGAALKNIFRGYVERKNWLNHVKYFEPGDIDSRIMDKFIRAFRKSRELKEDLTRLLKDFAHDRKSFPWHIRKRQLDFIGKIRRLLAEICLDALEPDIIILDEFQRFKYLLEEKGETGELAGQLFNYQNEESELKLILLSATPYKMYTVYSESGEDDHYTDFFRTTDFLFNYDEKNCRQFRAALRVYREALFNFGRGTEGRLESMKETIEEALKKVMVRTEKLAASADRNGMITEPNAGPGCITADDLLSYRVTDKAAEIAGVRNSVEYWKSAPYILNTMDKGYVLKSRFTAAAETEENREAFISLFAGARPHLLNWEAVRNYERIDPGNTKLRTLIGNTVGAGLWRFLWLPPSCPYYKPDGGPYKAADPAGQTKSLIFSAWQIVPKVIAQLCSYEAEREIFSRVEHTYDYSEESKKRRPLLNYAVSEGRLTGMPLFTLTYPCVTLALTIDPLNKGIGLASRGGPPHIEAVRSAVRKIIERLLSPLLKKYGRGSQQTSERWYWAAMLMLDREYYRDAVLKWLDSDDESYRWRDMVRTREEEELAGQGGGRFSGHVDFLQEHLEPDSEDQLFGQLGPPPEDLTDVLTGIALASPAVTVFRSLLRQAGPGTFDVISIELLGSAAYTAEEFRSLFNLPYATALIQQFGTQGFPYWRNVLEYCAGGNLQAVMDEYSHILKESLGLMDAPPAEVVSSIVEEIGAAVSIRTVNLSFDEIHIDRERERVELTPHSIRCRFALRFGSLQDETGEVTRSDQVRKAFNSPFHPFILATTSVGQEGLDFHQYCHDVYHWNLPPNPVDMEQREGRVHRYKGHAVRKNAADAVPLHSLSGGMKELEDLWELIFTRCLEMRDKSHSDLVPFWISDETKGLNRHKIRRYIPKILLSSENSRFEALRRSLITYRMVLGQPRQEDMLRHLEKQAGGDEAYLEELLKYKIDLSPG